MTTADRIRQEEGWKAHVYPDSLGFATIGYGFLVDSRRGEGLPKEVGEFWLDYEIRKTTEELKIRWLPYEEQPSDIQDVLVELAYQIGVDGILGFGKMLEALKVHNWDLASAELLDSQLHKQTPARAERLAARIKGESA